MSRKSFTVPDQQLWDDVKSTIAPVKKIRRRSSSALSQPSSVKHAKPVVPSPILRTGEGGRRPDEGPPPLSTFDRRTAQRLGRGQMEPEATIDLHGANLENARYQLLHFLSTRRMHGARLVLVITGKGASPFARHTLHGHSHFHTPEREGKIRREVPLWLEEAQFRIHVVGFQPAHPRHGGGGAFYVRLRRHQ